MSTAVNGPHVDVRAEDKTVVNLKSNETSKQQSKGLLPQARASGKHSTVEGDSKKRCIEGSLITFIIVAIDDKGETLKQGGDDVQAKWLEVPVGLSQPPPPEVLDNGNGGYVISCAINYVGEYSIRVLVNGVKLHPRLSISCFPSKATLTFDPTECQKDNAIGADGCTLTHIGTMWSSALGSRGMRDGRHSWRVEVTRSKHACIFVGVAQKGGLTAKRPNYNATYSWYGWDGDKKVMGEWLKTRDRRGWENDAVLELELNCEAHTLSITNLKNSQRDEIKNLPAAELFPYFALRDQNDSITLVQ